jgi:gas vesicle protein
LQVGGQMMQQNETNTKSKQAGTGTTAARGAVCSTSGFGMLLGGMAAGAALMYLFDPERGRGRRARLSDQLASKANRLGDRAEARARDLRNRAQGMMHEAGTWFRDRRQQNEGGNGRANQQPLGAQQTAPAQGM